MGEARCRLTLANGEQEGCEADRITTGLTGREIGPAARLKVDAEASWRTVGSGWIASDKLAPVSATIRQPSLQKTGQGGESSLLIFA